MTDAEIAAQLALCSMPHTGTEMAVDVVVYRSLLTELLERRQRDTQQDEA